jgi:KDO2-lipid IV(A) lauroyltransferase
MSAAEVLSCCALTGGDHFRQAAETRRGFVLVSAHLGNWEIGLQYLACRFQTPILLVVRSLRPGPADRWMNAVRSRFGHQVVEKKNAFPAMMKTIRQGGIVALMLDVSRRKQSVPVDFFGHRARASHAASLLAIRCNVPVIAAFSFRSPGGTFSIDIPPPFAIQRSGELKALLQSNTQLLTAAAEAAVRKHPDQYLWMQKRWKDYYPHLYPGYRPCSTPPGDESAGEIGLPR